MVSNGAFSLSSPKIKDFLINEAQAYKGGKNSLLWTVNKLRNIDKHRFLITTLDLASVKVSLSAGPMIMEDCVFNFTIGDTKTVLNVPPMNISITKGPNPTFIVRINENLILENTSAFSFLTKSLQDARKLLDSMEKI